MNEARLPAPVDQPITTPTFLFTDIAGSTRLWAEQRDAMGAALARHDAILRAAIEDAGGTVFKTVGDAVCAVFPAPLDAVAAAAAGQRALAAEDWGAFGEGFPRMSVRMALHTGLAEARDGDWFGQPLNRVARLLAAGHGGQVLVSRATEELVADHLPDGLGLRDLGEHRLKDLARGERVYQLVGADLPADFPALRSLDALLNNLPAQLTSFVGREEELQRLGRLLGQQRLLTLTGPGGTGKTRLAVQVAAEAVEGCPDGVWFVDLAPVASPEVVPVALAMPLGVAEEAERELLPVLLDFLRTRRLLVVLDNCEHMVAAAARLAVDVLAAAPGVRILATSREALAVPGEQVWPVEPLALPKLGAVATDPAALVGLLRSAAVRLFVDRAAAVKPDFAISAVNAAAVVGICQRLDGIPLAIELAAARVRHMAPEMILTRLDDRFRLLTTGARTALPRQQTLAAALDWSHDLLDDAERAVYRRLAVFRGGWTAEAAERVCADGGVEAWEALDLLGHLVDKSLVRSLETASGGSRYTMLDTMRHYAQERLLAAGEFPAAALRHAEWLRDLADEAEQHRPTADSGLWLEGLAVEMDNIRAVLDRTVGGDLPPEPGFVLAANSWWLWSARGSKREALTRIEKLLVGRSAAAPIGLVARVAYSAGSIAWQAGDADCADRHHRSALAGAAVAGDLRLQAWCWNDLGMQAGARRDFTAALDHLAQALTLKEQLGDLWDVAITLGLVGNFTAMAGDMVEGERLTARAVAIQRQAGNIGGLSWAMANLAEFEATRRDWIAARQHADEAIDLALESTNASVLAGCRFQRALVALHTGDYSTAWRVCLEALRGAVAIDDALVVGTMALHVSTWLAAELGHHQTAVQLGGAASPHGVAFSDLLPPTRERIQTALAASRLDLGAAAYDEAFAEGAAMSLEEACASCLAWLEQGPGDGGDR